MRLRVSLSRFWAAYSVLHERRQLLERPWEEDLLHWALDGSLHGHLPPPADGRRRSVTSEGWCPDWARQVSRSRRS
jgi:hypothetical protein